MARSALHLKRVLVLVLTALTAVLVGGCGGGDSGQGGAAAGTAAAENAAQAPKAYTPANAGRHAGSPVTSLMS